MMNLTLSEHLKYESYRLPLIHTLMMQNHSFREERIMLNFRLLMMIQIYSV